MNEHEPEDAFCLNCGSTDLYRDETSDDLICNVCNTKSQSLSQRETADDDLMTLLGRSNLHKTKSSSEVRVEDDFYTKDHVLPSLFDCTEAFLTVVEMAARRSVSPDLMPLPMTMQYDQLRHDVVNTAKEILLLYLERFDESANYFMVKYPKLRISLKDRFLTDVMREKVWLSLHVQNDKDNDKDKDRGSGDEEQTHLLSQISAADTPTPTPTRKQRSPKRVKWSDSQHSNNVPVPESQDLSLSLSPIGQETDTDTDINTNTDANNKQRTKSFLTEHGFIGRNRTHGLRQLTNTDDSLLWKLTVLEMRLDLNFLTSVVYLAHLCCQTGISSHHFIIWASSSSPSSSSSSTECQYPFLQDCFQSLHPNQQKKMHHIRESFVNRSMDLPDASVLDIGAILLLSCIIDMSGREDDEDEIPSLFRLNIERMKCMEILESDKKISRFLRGDRNIDTFQKKRRGRGSKTPVPENRRITQSQIRLQEVEAEAEAKSVGGSGGGGDGTQSSMSSQETVLQLGQMSQESQQSRESDEDDQDDDDDNNTTSSCEGPDRYSLAPQSEAFYNTGMMAARFCAYLGVDDKVLDFSHALMGLPVYCSKDDHALEEWLPSPLKLAHPSMLVSPLHVIAVIVVACKFTPGWMEWKVFRNISNGRTRDDNNKDDDSDSDSDSDASHDEDSISSEEGLNFLSSKRRKGRRKQQYVSRAKRKKVARKTTPMGETPQFIEKHCPMRFDYLDFMSTMTNGTNEDEKKTISDYFKDALSFSFGKTYGNNAGKDIPIVKANPIIGGATVDHATATATVETPELNESNGLSDYLPYPTVKKVSQRGGNEAVHGPYKALLGYFANRLFVDKHLLHYLVTLLDEEIQINAAKRERNNIATRTSTNNV